MTTVLERAVEYASTRQVISAEELGDLMARDVSEPLTGDQFAKILASGAFRAAASAKLKAGIKHEVIKADGARVHNVTLEDSYSTEDIV